MTINKTLKKIIDEIEGEKKYQHTESWMCPKCSHIGGRDSYCPNDRRKLKPEVTIWETNENVWHNSALTQAQTIISKYLEEK